MITYTLLQQYWWLLVSLLGALVVFLMFVQGANTQIFTLGRTEGERALIVNSTGRKWEFTFTTLVTFGGAFFASFPLFYSTSFGGAYWGVECSSSSASCSKPSAMSSKANSATSWARTPIAGFSS